MRNPTDGAYIAMYVLTFLFSLVNWLTPIFLVFCGITMLIHPAPWISSNVSHALSALAFVVAARQILKEKKNA